MGSTLGCLEPQVVSKYQSGEDSGSLSSAYVYILYYIRNIVYMYILYMYTCPTLGSQSPNQPLFCEAPRHLLRDRFRRPSSDKSRASRAPEDQIHMRILPNMIPAIPPHIYIYIKVYISIYIYIYICMYIGPCNQNVRFLSSFCLLGP